MLGFRWLNVCWCDSATACVIIIAVALFSFRWDYEDWRLVRVVECTVLYIVCCLIVGLPREGTFLLPLLNSCYFGESSPGISLMTWSEGTDIYLGVCSLVLLETTPAAVLKRTLAWSELFCPLDCKLLVVRTYWLLTDGKPWESDYVPIVLFSSSNCSMGVTGLASHKRLEAVSLLCVPTLLTMPLVDTGSFRVLAGCRKPNGVLILFLGFKLLPGYCYNLRKSIVIWAFDWDTERFFSTGIWREDLLRDLGLFFTILLGLGAFEITVGCFSGDCER